MVVMEPGLDPFGEVANAEAVDPAAALSMQRAGARGSVGACVSLPLSFDDTPFLIPRQKIPVLNQPPCRRLTKDFQWEIRIPKHHNFDESSGNFLQAASKRGCSIPTIFVPSDVSLDLSGLTRFRTFPHRQQSCPGSEPPVLTFSLCCCFVCTHCFAELVPSRWKPITIATTTPVISPPTTASNSHTGIPKPVL